VPSLDFPNPVSVAEKDESVTPAPASAGLYELVLEVNDLAAAEHFYGEVLGLKFVERWGNDRPAVWFGLGGDAFLGLWSVAAGGEKAIHHGRGGSHVHYAIRFRKGGLAAMEERLVSLGYDVEHFDFGNGNHSIYIDDPDGNVVEFAEWPTLWDGTKSSI
jgi:catechol 2,3-dioxygenase-like lactoylglutathione lyase family enzyme